MDLGLVQKKALTTKLKEFLNNLYLSKTKTNMSEINPSVPQEQPTQKVENTQNQIETKPLTPKQIEQRVLEEALELSWLNLDDLKKFYKDCSSCNLKILKQELQTTPEDQLIEKKAHELYKEYLENSLSNKDKINEVVSLKNLTESIDSPRLEDMKNEVEKVLDWALKKYDFLDAQSKNFVKIWIVNSMLKSPVWEIWESLIWGFANFVEKLKDVKQDDLAWMVNSLKSTPKDSWRTLTLQEKFAKNLESYTKKFDEINNKFEELKITDEKQKQNIISHIDWFKNPALIEAWVNWLDLSQLNINNKDKKNETLDTKAISEYMVNSREKILDLSKKLNMWDKAWDTIYELINGWWMVWEWVQKIVEIILKLPFIWKFFAMFLGLNPDPEKALSELKENSSNFKLVSALKWLWASKDKEGKQVEGKKPFEKIDLSWVNFNSVKNEIKEIKAITWEKDEEWYQKMWQEAFDGKYEKDWVTLKFEISDEQKKDNKISNSELKEILKNGLWKFNEDKEKNKTKADTEKREKEQKENEKKITELNSEKDTLNSQINNITSIINKDYEKIRHWDNWLNVGDISDIKTQDVINHNGGDFNTLIETSLKTGSLDDLIDSELKLINQLFSFIKDYCKENSLSNQWEIKDFLKNNETWFNTWLENKKTKLTKQIDSGKEELAKLTWNKEKLDFAKTVWDKINNISVPWVKLSSWIEIWKDKTIRFENEKLFIWSDSFKISWIDATLTDIVINKNTVDFEWKIGILSWKKEIKKETFVNGIQNLVESWKFEFNNEWKTINIQKV